MDPHKPLANRLNSAQSAQGARMGFANARPMRESAVRVIERTAFALICQDCYPSLQLWPVLNKDGPPFRAGGFAVFRQRPFSAFSLPLVALRMALRLVPIRQGLARSSTNNRGSLSCTNLSPRWRLLWFLPLATARSIRIALGWAHWGALPSGSPRATIWPRAPLSVACWARLPAIRACAADLTNPATRSRCCTTRQGHPGNSRMALSFLDPGRGSFGRGA